jgi:hypothetical protein
MSLAEAAVDASAKAAAAIRRVTGIFISPRAVDDQITIHKTHRCRRRVKHARLDAAA